MNPPVTYFGGKVGMAPLIVSLLPAHRVYMEPFFGSGAVLFAKRPSVHEIVNDLDGAVVAFYRVLRDRPDELAAVCELTPYARDEYLAANLDEAGLDDLEVARRFWVRVNQSFAKTAGRQTGWSITTARTQGVANAVKSRHSRLLACGARLRSVAIEHCDAADLVERLATPDTVVYCDPPYVGAARNSTNAASGRGDYRSDMPGEDDHRRLAKVLHATPAKVILSGYPDPLYEELYGDWWMHDVATTAHSSNAVTSARSTRTERLWCNYTPLHDQLDLGALA